MKLEYLYLDGYKGLKKLSIHFEEQKAPAAVNFLIGPNGAGKSRVLEAVGMIFTRIMQGETPGFDFEIHYRMTDGTIVRVKPQKEKSEVRNRLVVQTEKSGKIQEYVSVPNECLPDRIISCCSGANNSMEEILLSSPRDSLACDLYDLSQRNGETDYELYGSLLENMKQLDTNPRVICLDAAVSKLVLPVLYSVLPLDIQSRHREEIDQYCSLREELIGRLKWAVVPRAFSFRVNEEKLRNAGDLPQMNMLRQILREKEISDLVMERASAGQMDEKGNPISQTTAVFLYKQYKESGGNQYFHPGLQRLCGGNPFVLLSTLLDAYREGVISEVYFAFTHKDKDGLYEAEGLSDGELMWLARTGLVLMAQSDCGENTLFLFDEPDVHFNDDWNRDFIHILYKLCVEVEHQFLIATHSTLILTDALQEQVTLLANEQNGKIEEKPVQISTFGAQRDEISRQIFGTGTIGEYAANAIRHMMAETDPEKLLAYISEVGPGYQRYRLYGRYYSLVDEEAQEEL